MRVINTDCLEWLQGTNERFDCVFADPPDNIGLNYDTYVDRRSPEEYLEWLGDVLLACMQRSPTVWWSFNSKHTVAMGHIVHSILTKSGGENWDCKCCVQVYTFGQHNNNDLGNNHRPLWRLKHKDAPVYPDQIRIPSWRQRFGDKRASPKGRVPGDVLDMQYPSVECNSIGQWLSAALEDPGTCAEMKEDIRAWFEIRCGDVFDFPRVTGNNHQRQDWHPTQLHEELVERCIKLSTVEGQTVLDPFGGTGTTARVCERINRCCTLLELDPFYCEKIEEQFKAA